MTKETPVVTFTVGQPFDAAMRMVRRELARNGLRTPAELDVGSRIKQEVGAGVAPCVLLLVDDPVLLLEAVVFHRGAALFIPHPVVVSGNGRQTEVMVRSSDSLVAGGFPASVREPLRQLHARIVQSIQNIAITEEAHLAIG